ncbi:MAG: GH92 family glycosyl hydrolase [Bacteroidetes bacterium]|nr:GH92 family glycosyl hydrolase [Bacteroidota bacterium]
MIMKYLTLVSLFLGLIHLQAQQEAVSFVNPLIGTEKMGHTFPGATLPFGMVQLSPETDTIPYSTGKGYIKDVYRYCAGYQYTDNTITGFSHTHLSGTGHADLGDFLVMPYTGQRQLNPGTATAPETGYRSRFSHQHEKAEAGYYAVELSDYHIFAELTATERVGFHRYTQADGETMGLVLDMVSGIYNYPGKTIWTFLRVENDTLVTGYRQTRGWARTRMMYFAMTFSKPISDYGQENQEEIIYKGFYRKFNERAHFPEMAGKAVRAWFSFGGSPEAPLLVKMALSPVSTEGAIGNLSEIPDWDFDGIKALARKKWADELSKINIEADSSTKVSFYTAMYHAMLSPTIYMDTDQQYRGLDQNNHRADGFTNYTTFSLWDTYRALHPLFTLIEQQRTNDIIASMLAHREQSVHGILPIWSHHANENWCMIGYHAVPVIADAWMKGIRGYDTQKAFEAMTASANYSPYDGIGAYKQFGYVPSDLQTNAASKTLEYAYDDWCIASMADGMQLTDSARQFMGRAGSFQHIFDPSTGFMRPKTSTGDFMPDFDPMVTEGQGFIEGNAWNYSLYVPHDPARLIAWSHGPENFVQHLDSLFTQPLDEAHIEASEDITHDGIIGNYVHGNEPSHHIPYLFSYASAPWKTQLWVRQILKQLYSPTTNGLPGNDDCGQMSAWYIFSSLGFYPVCPGSNEYVLGSPQVTHATILMENGKTFCIEAIHQSDKHVYVKEVRLNGKPYSKLFLRHEDIIQGGKLEFVMSRKPNIRQTIHATDLPYSMSTAGQKQTNY